MNIRRWSITLVSCLLVFSALAAYKVLEIKAAIAFGESFPEQSETVEVFSAELVDYTENISAIGKVISPQRADLRNEQTGRVVKINFSSGANVEEGQLLLQLDISEEQARLRAVQARTELAKTVLQRAVNLRKSDAVSQEGLDRARADFTALEADIAALESTIRKKTIRAPFAGRTGLHQFEVGEYLDENTLVTTLVGNTSTMWVDFQVPQFYGSLVLDSSVQVQTINTLPSQALSYSAKIIAVGNVVNDVNRSLHYRAAIDRATIEHKESSTEIEDASVLPTPNTMVSVQVPIASNKPLVAVVALAIQHDHLGKYVYVLSPDEQAGGYRASRREISIVAQQGDRILLSAGLQAGELVAGAGAFKLHEGILVFTGERRMPEQQG